MRNFNDAFQQLDGCINERMQAFHTPAMVVALTDSTKAVRVSSYGFSNLETKEPVRNDQLFPIGSVGKSFTAAAVLQAREGGLISLRAPVTDYLPWFNVKSSFGPITIHHLLTHTSGLPGGTDFSPDPRAEVFALREMQVGFAPGKHFHYSDLGYKILGLVLEAVTAKSYEALIREKILEPLDMDHTFAVTTASQRQSTVSGYRFLYEDRPEHVSHPLVSADWIETNSGDGCILSTAEDLSKFARMILNAGSGPHGQVLSEESFRKLVHPMVEDEGETYGYGLYLFDDGGYQLAGHGGDVPGYAAYMWLDLSSSIGSIVLMSKPYTPRVSFLALEYFRSAYLNQRLPAAPPLPDFTHIKDPGQYAGTFHSEGCTLVLEGDGHHLDLVCDNQRVVLEEREPDSFYINHPSWNLFLLQFGRNKNGEVIEAFYGQQWFINERYSGPEMFPVPSEWDTYTGHYRSHNPWETNFRVFYRKGQLIYCAANGIEEILVPLGDGVFRIGEDEYIPERLGFDQIVDGKALRATRSSCPYYRFFTP